MHFIEKEPSQKRQDFVNKLKSNKILRVPGAYNPLTAKLMSEHVDCDVSKILSREMNLDQAGDKDRMSPRQAWRAIQAGMPEDVIISSDIGNNCAIGNAYPTFEKGRKYLAPGLFGPCGYGFPSILGAKIGCPQTPVIGFAGGSKTSINFLEPIF